MAGLAEGVGDEGCIEPLSHPGPELDPFWQGRVPLTVRARARERARPAEGRPVERVDKDIKGIWSGRLLAGGRECFLDLFVI